MPNVVIDYAPRRYFQAFHARHQKQSCIVAHRQAGKTMACIHDLQRAAIACQTVRPRFAYIAPYLKQAKTAAWDHLKAAAAPLVRHGVAINESELRVDYPANGAQVRLYGGDNPDALRGIYLDGVVLDEYADMDPKVWPEIISPTLVTRDGWVVFIGTAKGRDAFFGEWSKAVADQAKWFSLKLPASKTKILSEEVLAQKRETMSASQYAREFECSFDEPSVAQFIDTQMILEAQGRTTASPGVKLLGVDIARQGDDRTVALLRNGDTLSSDDILIWRNPDLMWTVGRIAELINEYRPRATLIDAPGLGWGVFDRLRQLGFPVIAVNGGEKAKRGDQFVNSRAEMWSRMRDWIRERGHLPQRDDLVTDLVGPSYSFDSSNRMQLEKKEDMKKRNVPSPDIADALALTFAKTFPIESHDTMSGVNVRWRTGVVPQADPLEGF